jgi:hypothetical protein
MVRFVEIAEIKLCMEALPEQVIIAGPFPANSQRQCYLADAIVKFATPV